MGTLLWFSQVSKSSIVNHLRRMKTTLPLFAIGTDRSPSLFLDKFIFSHFFCTALPWSFLSSYALTNGPVVRMPRHITATCHLLARTRLMRRQCEIWTWILKAWWRTLLEYISGDLIENPTAALWWAVTSLCRNRPCDRLFVFRCAGPSSSTSFRPGVILRSQQSWALLVLHQGCSCPSLLLYTLTGPPMPKAWQMFQKLSQGRTCVVATTTLAVVLKKLMWETILRPRGWGVWWSCGIQVFYTVSKVHKLYPENIRG